MRGKCKDCQYFEESLIQPVWGYCKIYHAKTRANAYSCASKKVKEMVDIENVFDGEEEFEVQFDGVDKLDIMEEEYMKNDEKAVDICKLQIENEKLNEKNKKLKGMINKFYGMNLQHLIDENKKLKEQLGDAEDYICELEERIRELEKENKTLINTVNDRDITIKRLEDELLILKNDTIEDLASKDNTISRLERENRIIKANLDVKIEGYERLYEAFAKRTDEYEKLEKERDNLKTDNRVIQERLDGIMSKACDGCAVCDRLSAAYDRLYEAYTKRGDKYMELVDECNKLKKENHIIQERLDGEQEDYNKLFDMFEKFKGEANTWKNKYEFLTTEHGKLKNFTIDILNQVLHGVGKEIELFAFNNTPYGDMLDAVKDALRVNKIQQGLSDNFEKAYFDLKREAERLESENMILRKQQVKAVHDIFFQNIYLSPPHIAALTDELYTQDLMLISLAEECSELAQVCTKSVKNSSLERGDIREMDAKLTEEVAHVLICIRGLAYCDAFGVCNFAKRVEEEIKKKWPDGYKD